MNTADTKVIRACLSAASDGPFFPDSEFSIIFGFERNEIKALATSWPKSEDEHTEFLAVNNSINNLLGYPHGKDAEWSDWVPIERDDLEILFEKIREASGSNDATRSRLKSELAHLLTLTDDQLAARSRHVADLVSIARSLGVAVPSRLER